MVIPRSQHILEALGPPPRFCHSVGPKEYYSHFTALERVA